MMYELGYSLLFLASFLAATVVPFSSELVLSGMLAAGFDPFVSLIVATLGNWMGGLTSYWLGWLGKWQWIEKYLRISEVKIMRAHTKIKGKEGWIAFFCWLPIVGDLLAVALGLIKSNFYRTALWMLIGKGGRYAVWGYLTMQTLRVIQ
ncbi:MAG TPA: VTT domain-containing protein [Marinilabiliaceae bacterium]|nr:VTT domain-containing protein [Marinilabiliaceae bacterium]